MRIAIGGIAHETNTFSTVSTGYDDFYRVEGDALISDPRWRELEKDGAEIVPLFLAHATPSGKVTKDAFSRLLEELLSGLRTAKPLDGVLLTLHGAMEVEEIGDGETAILRAVRAEFGADLFITVTLDLHANLAPEVVSSTELITAYRTAPHRDAEETHLRGMTCMVDCLRKGLRPLSRMVKLPLLLSGEAAVTEVEPTKSLYERLPIIDRRPGILVSSIVIGCAWTDSPFTAVSTVVCGSEENAVTVTAEELASELWKKRHDFRVDSITADIPGSVARALGSVSKPVFISDSGDNTTACAAGDCPLLLKYLVEQEVSGALVAGITDPEAVHTCLGAGEGTELRVTIGGKLDTVNAAPYSCRGVVRSIIRPQKSGEDLGNRVLLRVGPVEVVLQEDRVPFTELSHFYRMQLDPADYTIVVVKEGYLFPELRDYAPSHIMALSPGFADQCLERLPYKHLLRPIYPL